MAAAMGVRDRFFGLSGMTGWSGHDPYVAPASGPDPVKAGAGSEKAGADPDEESLPT